MSPSLLNQSFEDLTDDFQELLFLYEDARNKVITLFHHADLYTTYIQNLRTEQKKLHESSKTAENLVLFTDIKMQFANLLRTLQGIIGSLITATDWQSPSFLHSLHSQAGRQTGKIIGTINDYKRDQHLGAQEYEHLFLKECIDGFFKLPIKVYATVSGMAAFTTILNYLLMEQKIKNTVLIGKSIYFENKELVKKMFPDRVIEVDEHDTEKIKQLITLHQPSVIIFDSLCNSSDIAVPDLDEVMTFLLKNIKTETYLLIDNTGLSIFFQPLKRMSAFNRNLTCIVFESLNKYHQFGMDRVTGGIIYAIGKDVGKLSTYRGHLGTNIPDSSVCTLPKPNRKILEKRMFRHARNTTTIAHVLQTYIQTTKNKTITAIVYPGLTNHPSYNWSAPFPFHGSYFVLQFAEKYRKVSIYKRFVSEVIKEAKKQNVDIVSGTSFGLNTTRIYLTALRSDIAEPFIRVAAGTEHRLQIEKLKDVFVKVVDTF